MASDDEAEFISQDDVLEVIELVDNPSNGAAPVDDDGDEESEDEAEAEPVDMDADAASIAVDNSIVTFSKHTADVFSIDISPPYVASGGEDDRAYVWKIEDGNVVFECTGHSDSVTYVRFNARKTLLATACIAGSIQIWRIQDFTSVGQFQVGDLSWLQWHHAADILFCGTEDGSMWMYLVPNGDCKVFSGYGHPCTAGELFPDGKRICAGYADGGVRIWDLKTSAFANVEGASVHKSPVTCIEVSPDNALAASGSEDGTVNLIHGVSGKIVASFVCAKSEGRNQPQEASGDGEDQLEEDDSVSVEALAFSKSAPVLFTGTVNGDMAIWDLNTHVVRQTFPKQEGIVKAVWLDHCILVADLGGVLRLYDARNGALVSQWTGHKGAILDFALSPDTKTLVSSSADHTCKVFQVDIQR